jgi:hypothetical protein
LIKTFIDKNAVFEFVSRDSEIPKDAIGFTLPKAEIQPSETETTFDVLVRRYSVNDPVVRWIADILCDFEIDAEEDLGCVKRKETAGAFCIVRGLARTSKSDHEIVFKAMIVMDALYAELKVRMEGGE